MRYVRRQRLKIYAQSERTLESLLNLRRAMFRFIRFFDQNVKKNNW